ncbi:MAG: chloride channel protein, partial [Anaerolineae bacterium]
MQPPEALVAVGLAVLAGLAVGGAYLVFHYLIALVHEIGFVRAAAWLSALGPFYVVLIPALGGLLVGPLVVYLAPEAKGHGVPEVMEAVALRGGRIRPVVAMVKSVASAITIGSGGSVGREGPIVQIGSALGSALGQWLHLSDRRIRTLVACGAAGGIAATFNAPIAGVIFAVEVILGELEVESIGNVVIAAVTASVVGRLVFGASPVFPVPRYSLVSPWELAFYVVLGALAAVVGVAFIRMLYALEDVFGRWRAPAYLKPAAGGLLVGLVGLAYPQVFGSGYETIGKSLLGTMGVGLALALLVAKLLATSFTLGSGASGGIFAPSLYMGAMLGAAFGSVVHALWPAITAGSGAYAIVGMAAVFSGAARAPLTAMMILFEMTDDYRIILPLMLSCVVSTLVASRLHRESIYTEKLVRRGIRLQRGRDIDVMQGITVGEVMEANPEWVPPDMPLRDLADKFATSHYHGFPVLDEEGNLYGVVTLEDLERVTREGKRRPGATVRDIATTSLVVA